MPKVHGCARFGLGSILALILAPTLGVGCSSGSTPGTSSGPDASQVDAESDAAPEAAPPSEASAGSCKTTKWVGISDACWSCFCSKCATAVDQCDSACQMGVDCASTNHLLVGVEADLTCEERAFASVCQSNPTINAAYNLLYAFDVCLITNHVPNKDMLRACETECGTTYTGDVCQRFPAMDAGPSTTDAGPSTTDAGPSTTDGGPPTTDAGPSTTDSGLAGADAG